MAETTRELTSAIACGDRCAFGRFYDRWFPVMLAEARRTCDKDESFCLDVVQEAMLRVIKSIRPLDSEAALHAWLRAVVRSAAYDLLRRDQRRRSREQNEPRPSGSGMAACGWTPTAPSPSRLVPRADDELLAAERLAWLRRTLAALEPEQAHMLSLRFRLGWTLQRIASFLGLKPGAVDGRITRTLAALNARAQEDFDEGEGNRQQAVGSSYE